MNLIVYTKFLQTIKSPGLNEFLPKNLIERNYISLIEFCKI